MVFVILVARIEAYLRMIELTYEQLNIIKACAKNIDYFQSIVSILGQQSANNSVDECIARVQRDGQILDIISGSCDHSHIHQFADPRFQEAVIDCLVYAIDHCSTQEQIVQGNILLRFVPDGTENALMIVQAIELASHSLALQVLDNTNTAIIIADVQKEDMPIIYVNRTFTEVTGYSSQETIGLNARFLQGSQRDQPGVKVMQQAITEGTDCRVVVQNFRKDGEAFWNEVYLSPIRSSGGQITHYVGIQNDITEHKKIEDALKLSEANLSVIFDHIPISIFFIDPNFRIRAANNLARQNAWAILGDAYETTDDFIAYMPDDMKERFIQHCDYVLAGETLSYEHQLSTQDDQLRTFQTMMIPLRPQESDIIGICLISTDITQQKQTEQALRTSEQRYRDIVELQPGFICRFKPDTTLTFVNETYARYFDRDRDELLGESFLTSVPEHEHEGIRKHIHRAISGHAPVEYEHEARAANGAIRWQRWVDMPIFDEDGTLLELQAAGQDITKQKLAEQALRLSEARYKAVSELISDYAFYTRLSDTKPLEPDWLTESVERVTGYSAADFSKLSQHPFLFHEDDQARAREDFHRVRNGESFSAEYRILRKDGAIRWLRLFRRPVLDKTTQQVIGYYGVAQDITERKEAKAAQQESEERFRLIFESSDVGIMLTDRENRIIEVNPAICALLGHKHDSLINQDFERFIHPGYQNQERILRHELQSGTRGNYVLELQYITTSDKIVWVNSTVSVKRDENGYPIYYINIVQDITEKKQAIQALHRSEEVLRETGRLARVGGWEINSETLQPIWTEETYRIHEIPVGTSISMEDVINCYEESIRPILLDKFRRTLEKGESFYIEGALESNNRQKKWVRIIGKADVQHKQVMRVHGTIQDITERKETENELRRTKERAEAANRTKSIFIANVSHELRTPLNAILGFAQLLQNSPRLNAEEMNYVKLINNSGAQLLHLINDILEVSRIEAGHLQANIEDFDLYDMLYRLHAMFQTQATNKDLTFTLEIAQNVSQYIRTDRGKLRQIIINLLSNAIKFTSDGGVTVSAFTSDTNQLTIVVEDTGIGIPAEDKPLLFEPFMQTEVGRRQQGSGLGLAICHQFATFLEGTLSVESTIDGGSTFTLVLPVEITPVIATNPQRSTSQATGLALGQPDYRILVVDNHPENRLILVRQLQRIGFNVREAPDGREAIDIAERWQPSLIFMDLQMPELNGYEAAQIIKSDKNTEETIIIALATSVSGHQKRQIVDAGCDDYLIKPYTDFTLIETLKHHLGVTFAYANQDAPMPLPIQLVDESVPQALIDKLEIAAQDLDYAAVVHIIKRIQGYSERFAAVLNDWANEFEFDKILDAIQQYRRAADDE